MENFRLKITQKLNHLRDDGLLRSLRECDRFANASITLEGQEYISFSCNDYLGLSQNDDVKRAGVKAIEKYGAGSGASRYITGNNSLNGKLESLIAKSKAMDDAAIFGSGYLSGIGVIPALVSKGDLVIADRLIHSCLLDGIRLSGAKLIRFAHNDVNSCEEVLKKHRNDYQNCLIITETVFSMDGDLAPIDNIFDLGLKYDSLLLCDDAHGFGVLDDRQKKISADMRKSGIYIEMGTLSKAAGCYGGYVAGDNEIIEYIRNFARSNIYTTALAPAVIASAIKAIEIINNDKKLCKKPLNNARYFTDLLGIDEAQSPIVAVILECADKTVKASLKLQNEGFFVSAIRPPTVERGKSRLRLTFCADHKKEDIERLAKNISLIIKESKTRI